MAEHLEAPKSTEGMTYIYKYFINLIKFIYFQRSTNWAVLQYMFHKVLNMENRIILYGRFENDFEKKVNIIHFDRWILWTI